MAQRRPERIHGMIFLGPGFNCLRPGYWYHYNMLPDEVRARVDAGEEHIKIKMRYGGVGILRRDFCENTLAYEIDFSQPLPIHCPVRIIHAVQVTSGSSITQKVPHFYNIFAHWQALKLYSNIRAFLVLICQSWFRQQLTFTSYQISPHYVYKTRTISYVLF